MYFYLRTQVSMLPENDRWSETRAQLLAQMDVSMGGRVAEELIFGDENITTGGHLYWWQISFLCLVRSFLKYCSFITGASSDFDGATKIAKLMVTRFGMSDKVWLLIEIDKVSWLACVLWILFFFNDMACFLFFWKCIECLWCKTFCQLYIV